MNNCLLFNVSTEKNLATRCPGVYRIAHYLRENNWDVEVIEYAKYWTVDELKALAKSRIDANTKFLGFSHMFSIWSAPLEEFCLWMKLTYPNIVIISGSPVKPNFTSKAIDYYIQGFGELALVELLKYLFSNGTRPKINIFNDGSKKIIEANNSNPSYPMSSLMIKYQDRDFIIPEEWLGIEFARGCKFACDFCNFPVLGVKGDYSRDAEDFREQMQDTYDRFGVSNYLVADETFNDSTEKITKFADAVEQLTFTPWFSGFLRADLMISRPKDQEELLRMNFLGHYYGVESFNTKTAKAVGKGMDGERVKQGLLDIKNYFKSHGRKQYRGTISLMVGLPYETPQTIEETTQWLIDHWQGESFVTFAMEIMISDLDKKSKIALDHKKYGYTAMSEQQIAEAEAEFRDRRYFPNVVVGMSPNYLKWQNEYMNLYTATELTDAMYKVNYNDNYDFKMDCWGLANPGMSGSIEDKLTVRRGAWDGLLPSAAGERLIPKYIQNKLNWR